MDKRKLKIYLFSFLGILIFIFVAKLFIRILPYLIIAGIVCYIVFKILDLINSKKTKETDSKKEDTINFSSGESYDIKNVIDVEYEEVKKDDK